MADLLRGEIGRSMQKVNKSYSQGLETNVMTVKVMKMQESANGSKTDNPF